MPNPGSWPIPGATPLATLQERGPSFSLEWKQTLTVLLSTMHMLSLEKVECQKDVNKRDFAGVTPVYESFIAVLRKNLVRVTELSVANSLPGLNTRYKQELVGLKLQYANAWIQYMRFSRRSQGRMSGLVVFVKACEDEFVGWDVYEAAALLEYRTNVEDGGRVAIQTFEAGMEASFRSFLLRINLQQNARELFERVIATFSPEEAKPIWDCWSESLYEYDTLEAVLQTESRIAEIYPNDPPLKRFGRRHVYRGTDPIADHDLGFTHVKAQAANSVYRPSEHKRLRLAGSDE
ncbi:hypothetical protein R3P38DRAFT_2798722 [Favolaschia claudopus]|uniref:mRNA 3'-end-processing protein RNA14 n=1 Tax=Favolaschia claudopus TaxID=2862362 RepID=A0AAW0A2G5_9AGAR